MNGEEELESTQAIVQKYDEALNKYETGIGLNSYVLHSEAEKYLNMPHDELRKLSAEDCGEAAVVLAQLSFSIQKHYNQELARIGLCEEEIRRTITNEISQYRGNSFEERKMQAIRGNDKAIKLDRIKGWAQARANRLSYLASKIEFLSRTFLDYQQTKRRQAGRQGDF